MPGVSSAATGVITSGLSSSIPSATGAFSSFLPAFGAGLDAAGGFLGGLFNANQARKNRQFQERMYNKQVEDNIRFWEMQNRYNLPSAMKQRLEDAGLNSLLMYGSGGQSMVAASPIQAGQAPSGGQASMSSHTNFGQALAQTALIQAQIRNINADTLQKETAAESNQANTQSTQYNTYFQKLTQRLRLSLMHGNLDQIFAATDNLREQTYTTGQMTLQSTLSMMQAREYEIKRFHLDANTIGEQLAQRWKELANGEKVANAQLRNSFAAMLNAKANWNLSNAQVGQIALNMSQSREMFPLLVENQRGANWNQVTDRIFKGVQISNAQKDGFMKDMNNYLQSHGVGPDSWLYKFAGPFVLPTIQINDELFGRPQYKPVNWYNK